MSPYTPPTLPLVWVTAGKTQHAAYLIDEDQSECLIQWTTTQQIEKVRTDRVQKSLSPRRRKTPDRLSDKLPLDISKKQRIASSSEPDLRPQESHTASPRFSLTRHTSVKGKRRSTHREQVKSTIFYSTRDDETVASSDSPPSFTDTIPVGLLDDQTDDDASRPQHQKQLRNEQQKEKAATLAETSKDELINTEVLENTEGSTSAMADD